MGWTSFEDIELWHLTRYICRQVWDIVNRGKARLDNGVRYQMLNSSSSTMDNVAEGFERGSNQEFKTFLGYPRGSAGELRSQLYRLNDGRILDNSKFEELNV